MALRRTMSMPPKISLAAGSATKRPKRELPNCCGNFRWTKGPSKLKPSDSCSEDLERLDRMLTALEFRRDKALRCVADYRQILSKQLQQAADRILDNDDVPRLVSRSG